MLIQPFNNMRVPLDFHESNAYCRSLRHLLSSAYCTQQLRLSGWEEVSQLPLQIHYAEHAGLVCRWTRHVWIGIPKIRRYPWRSKPSRTWHCHCCMCQPRATYGVICAHALAKKLMTIWDHGPSHCFNKNHERLRPMVLQRIDMRHTQREWS